MKFRVLVSFAFFAVSAFVIGLQVNEVEAKINTPPVTSPSPITGPKPVGPTPTPRPITAPKTVR